MHTHGSLELKAGTEYRIDLGRLIKPGAGAGAFSGRLKPQKVGLDESWYTYQASHGRYSRYYCRERYHPRRQ